MFRQITRLIAALAILIVPLASNAHAFPNDPQELNRVQSDPANIKKIEVIFCVNRMDMAPPPGSASVISGLKRTSYAGYVQAGIGITPDFSVEPSCFEKAGNGCYGAPGKVYCNFLTLANVLHRMALVAASGAANMIRHTEESKDGLRFDDKIGWERASELAEIFAMPMSDTKRENAIDVIIGHGVARQDVVEATLISRNIFDYDGDHNADLIKYGASTVFSYPIFEAGVNYLFAYIFGHEFAHAYRGCIHTMPSLEETSGRFALLLKTQSDGVTFQPNPMLLDEALADRCGLRAVEAIDKEMVAFKRSRDAPQMMLALMTTSRRLAIDALSNIMMVGLGRRWSEGTNWRAPGADGLSTTEYRAERKPGYIYAPVRLALFSELLHGLESQNPKLVRICDWSAKQFVLGLNLAIAIPVDGTSPKTGKIDHKELPALFGNIVGAKIVDGWKTGKWDEHTSFKCD